jgi:anti-sigma factor RsiW
MNCRQFIEFLTAYRAGELPDDQRAEFERHLQKCPPCVCYMRTYETTIELAKDCCCCDDTPVPDEVPDQLVKAILAARKKG